MADKFDTESIIQNTNLVELVSRYVQLQKAGKEYEYKGLCPFHKEKTPSFTVSEEKKFYHCFGCGAHGDAIAWLSEIEGIDFQESCKRLLNGSGTTLPAPKPMPQVELKKPPKRVTTPPPEGAPPPDMAIKGLGGEPSATWAYRTAEGKPLGFVARYDPPEGKQIRVWSWGSRGGADVPGWACGHWTAPRPLYGLDRLAERPKARVLVAEGEKAADAAGRLFPGMVAITWPGGANAVKYADWTPLQGRQCVLWPDNDEPGIACMGSLARLLTGIASEIKGIKVTDMPINFDAADWTADMGEALPWAKPRVFTYQNDIPHSEIPPIEAYSASEAGQMTEDTPDDPATQPAHVSAKLVGIYDKHQPPIAPGDGLCADMGVVSFRASDRGLEVQDWLWEEKIATGVITGLSGDPGLGKSQITASLAAIVTTGGQWPVTRDYAPKGTVIILNCEDNFATTIGPRLMAAGADMSKIVMFEGVATMSAAGVAGERLFDLSADIAKLVAMIERIGDVRLVIIDPISAYVGIQSKVDSHNNTDVRSLLAPLAQAARSDPKTGRKGAAIVIVNHLNKDSGKSPLHRTQGSVAWTAAPRCIWAVARDKDDETGQRRFFSCIKNNIGPDQAGFAYEIEPTTVQAVAGDDQPIKTSRVMWHAEAVEKDISDIFESSSREEKSAMQEAIRFLRDELASGPVPSKEIKRMARDSGISDATLNRARIGMKLIAARVGGLGGRGHWEWSLPSAPRSYADRDRD